MVRKSYGQMSRFLDFLLDILWNRAYSRTMSNISRRTQAITTTFAAFFTASQYALLFTTNGVKLAALGGYAASLYSTYGILITQPGMSPISGYTGPAFPVFPDVAPNDEILTDAIEAAALTIGQLNTLVQSLTLAEAQAAANARLLRNSYPGAVNQATGFLYADAATALQQLQASTEAQLSSINAALAESNDE